MKVKSLKKGLDIGLDMYYILNPFLVQESPKRQTRPSRGYTGDLREGKRIKFKNRGKSKCLLGLTYIVNLPCDLLTSLSQGGPPRGITGREPSSIEER